VGAKAERSDEGQADPDSQRDQLTAVAKHTLEFFSETAADAQEQLGKGRTVGPDDLVAGNAMTGDQAARNLDAIGEMRASEMRLLSVEPAIARIVAIDEAGKARTYFISRATPHRSPRDGSAVPSSYVSGHHNRRPVASSHNSNFASAVPGQVVSIVAASY
jgi:hypothetical protein